MNPEMFMIFVTCAFSCATSAVHAPPKREARTAYPRSRSVRRLNTIYLRIHAPSGQSEYFSKLSITYPHISLDLTC